MMMRSLKLFGALGISAAALLLVAGLPAGPARAAQTVDITYDLSDTTIEALTGAGQKAVLTIANDNPVNGTVAGSMKVRYTSDSSTGMPIETGPVTLLSLNLSADWILQSVRVSGTRSLHPYTVNVGGGLSGFLTGSFNWQLGGGPIAGGSLLSSGTLTGLTGALSMTGGLHCTVDTLAGPGYTGACQFLFLLPGSLRVPVTRTGSGPLTLAGAPGPYGGAQSTPHTLTGGAGLPQGLNFAGFVFSEAYTHNGYGGVQLVGREVLREAEGLPPKPVPEPGTLLLLGAGAAGLALVGRATRRSRQR